MDKTHAYMRKWHDLPRYEHIPESTVVFDIEHLYPNSVLQLKHGRVITTQYATYKCNLVPICDECDGRKYIPIERTTAGGTIPVDSELCQSCDGLGYNADSKELVKGD